jgi:teichuronic acid biosynthesis glycosyltransferase TuaG
MGQILKGTTSAFPKNSGPAYARMIGVQAAQTEWIAFLDSDDVWAPNHLENASRIIAENPHVRLI